MNWREDSLVTSSGLFFDDDIKSNSNDVDYKEGRTWKHYIGNVATLLCYNKATPKLAAIYISSCFIFNSGILAILYTYDKALNAIFFIPYFMTGIFASSCMGILHQLLYRYTLYYFTRFLQYLILIFFFITRHGKVADQSNSHSDDYSSDTYTCNTDNRVLNFIVNATQANFFCPRKSKSPSNSSKSILFYLWRHTPDILTIGCALLETTVGHLDKAPGMIYIGYVFIHWLVLAYIIVSMLQVGSARFNMSRYFLETPVLNMLGYCSYSLYIFHRAIVEYYVVYIYEDRYNFICNPLLSLLLIYTSEVKK